MAAGETARIVFNGVEWGGAAGAGRTLYDRDELDTGSVKLVVCDSSTAKTVKERQIKAALATLPPAAGVASPSSSSPIHSLHSQSLNVEATNTLPKVSSQSEPSAAMGSGSGLFGGGRGANNPASSTEGRFGLGEGARDGDAGMWAQGRGGIGETDEVPETGAPGVPQNRQRSLYSGGAGGTEPRGFGTNRAPGEIGAAQRFGQPLPSEEEEVDEFAEMRRSRTQMLVGLAVLILVLIVVGVLISVIRGQ